MEFSTATEGDCIVSQKPARQRGGRLAADNGAARPAAESRSVDSLAALAIECEIGHRLPKFSLSLGALDCRLGGGIPNGWVYEMSGSHKLPKAGGIRSILFSCAGKPDFPGEPALRLVK